MTAAPESKSPRDAFDVFGIEPTLSVDLPALERSWHDLSRVVHPDRIGAAGAVDAAQALARAAEVNAAWRTLRDPVARARLWLARRGAATPLGTTKAPTVLAMRGFEILEAVERYRAQEGPADAAEIRRLGAAVDHDRSAALGRLQALFRTSDTETVGPDFNSTLTAVLDELAYLGRQSNQISEVLDPE